MKYKFFLVSFCFLLIFSSSISAQLSTAGLVSDADVKNAVLTRPRIYQGSGNKEISSNNATNISNLERQGFELINKKRVEKGLEPLIWNNDCSKIARLHSENMANAKFFNHAGLDGTMVNDRADAIGLSKWRAIGENIAFNRGYEHPLEAAVEGWFNSESHRENILDSRWKESAVGIAIAPDGSYYFTQVFLLRK